MMGRDASGSARRDGTRDVDDDVDDDDDDDDDDEDEDDVDVETRRTRGARRRDEIVIERHPGMNPNARIRDARVRDDARAIDR